MSKFSEPPSEVVEKLDAICSQLAETRRTKAWAGTRWLVRRHSIAHVFTMATDEEPMTAGMFRSAGPEFEALRAAGLPFIVLPGGRNAVMMVINERTDWGEVRELVTESYCLMAPKKLVALIPPPSRTPCVRSLVEVLRPQQK